MCRESREDEIDCAALCCYPIKIGTYELLSEMDSPVRERTVYHVTVLTVCLQRMAIMRMKLL